jgi:hypothetical protein
MKSKIAMLMLFVVATAVAFRANASGQTATGEIRGKVSGAGGAPLAGATVVVRSLVEGAGATIKTGADGTYRAATLAPGVYQVAFTMADYAPATVERVRVASAPIAIDRTLVSGAAAERIAILAGEANPAAGRLTGRIADAGGKPLPYAWIGLQSSVSGLPTFQRTDAEGRFDVASLPVGLYTLHAAAGGYEAVTQYPTVTEGQTTTADVALWASSDVLGRPFLAAASLRQGEWLLSIETALGRTFVAMAADAPPAFRQAVEAHAYDGGRIVAREKDDATRVLELSPAPGAAASILRFDQPVTGDVKFVYDAVKTTGRILEGADTFLEIPPAKSDAGPSGAPVLTMAVVRGPS